MITYATLTQLRERLGIPDDDTDDDASLLAALRRATAQLDRFTARRFAPAVQTRRVDYQGPYSLHFDIDLLEVLAITNGDGLAISPDDVTLLPEADGPKYALMLDVGAGTPFVYETRREAALTVKGIWGWHDAWAEAWRDTGDTVAGTLSDSTGTITVSDADGADALNLAPRFQVGQLLRLEDEYVHVTAVDADTNTLTVVLGVRGTTAASHAAGTAIDCYVPPQDVTALCLRWAAWLYQKQDAAFGDGADWLFPANVPDDLRTLASELRFVRVA